MGYILKQKHTVKEDGVLLTLKEGLHISEELAFLLYTRGISSVEEGRLFLYPKKEQLHSPFLFKDMEDCVSMVKHAIAMKGKVCIYGDYDADGTSASAIMYKTLKAMGADVCCKLPSRLEHGYGLTEEAIKSIADFNLLITVDCGITAVKEIALAKEFGINTIITDHHECGTVLPAADCILNPKCENETYPYKNLCGAGVAFKFAQALIGQEAFSYIDLAAIATIADIVPLKDENRVIASLGLEKLNTNPNAGIKMLYDKAGFKKEKISAQTIAFGIASRLNAPGRISSAQATFDLLVKEDKNALEVLATELCELNSKRQVLQETITTQALQMKVDPDDRIIVLWNKDWDVGIVGLAAAKVAEHYNKPAVLFSEVNGKFTGSARSISGVNLHEVFSTQEELYEKFGGHAGAVGLTVTKENLQTIKHRLNLCMKEKYDDSVFMPVRYFDIDIKSSKITQNLISDLARLEPCGHENEAVKLCIKDAQIVDIRPIADNKHAKFSIKDGKESLSAVCFGRKAGDIPLKADVVGYAEINSYDNRPQLIVDVLSYESTLEEKFNLAQNYVENTHKPEKKRQYFCDRNMLIETFTILKRLSDGEVSFKSMNELVAFMLKQQKNMNVERLAFAFCLFFEIKLLTVKKGDTIKVGVNTGKRELESSCIYKKFKSEE